MSPTKRLGDRTPPMVANSTPLLRVAIVSRFPANPEQPRGGVESVTVVLSRALAEIGGIDVHVLAFHNATRTVVDRFGRLTVHRLRRSRFPQMLDVLAGPGQWRLQKYLTRLAPDLVHAHETWGLGLGRFPIPTICTIHGFDHANLLANGSRFASFRAPLWRCVERFGIGRQHHIISITPYVREMIAPLTKATIHEIENPVDERFFSTGRSEETGRILCVGWITERKNTLGSVMAWAEALKQGACGRLIIAGAPREPEYLERIKAFIKANQLASKIDFIGHISQEQLVSELKRASVLMLPSRQENSPMAIAEAMAIGVPVISSKRCGMPYMVEEGVTGFLFEPDDIAGIAGALRRLLKEGELRLNMGAAARLRAEQRFHPAMVARRTRAVYDRVLSQSN